MMVQRRARALHWGVAFGLLLSGCGESGAMGIREGLPTPEPLVDIAGQSQVDSEYELLDDDGYSAGPSEGVLTPDHHAELARRRYDYGAAMRTASLRLLGALPTLAEIEELQSSADPKATYEEIIDRYLDDARFQDQILAFWRDTMKIGSPNGGELDSAALFATSLVVFNRPMEQLLTASEGNCPTLDEEDGFINAETCQSGAPEEVGVLTNPQVMAHFFSNLAFRRARWVQETFMCGAFPAEVVEPVEIGEGRYYRSPWDHGSIAGEANGGRVDFLDVESVVCANCHSTMNHVAPLLANFDESGMWSDDFAVPLPLDGAPLAEMSDWLPEGEGTAWRHGVPAADLAELGAAVAADESFARCLSTRVWNWAMGHGDVVADAEIVPQAVSAPLVDAYEAGGHHLKDVIRAAFTNEHFVRF